MTAKTAQATTFWVFAVLAILCFLYAVAVLGFQWFFPSCLDQKTNAVWLAAAWAILPPVWFAFERWKWETAENKQELKDAQEHARDFWLGLGAIVLFLADKRF